MNLKIFICILKSRLIDLIGDAGKKLHTARSRNDQVATSFKMWVRDDLDIVLELIKNLQAVSNLLMLNRMLRLFYQDLRIYNLHSQ